MNTQNGLQCISIRGRAHPGERCSNRSTAGEWCGKHKTVQIRFQQAVVDPIEHIIALRSPRKSCDVSSADAVNKIRAIWGRWIARRAGPLLRFREESNNPFDFFSSDPVEDIPFGDVVSFVSGGKGYIMDIKSAVSLIEHAVKNKEEPVNPFNRAVLPPLFLKRVALHSQKGAKTWAMLEPISETQKLVLDTTDLFRGIEDLGYYTDPSWFIDLTRQGLQRLYMELADIWFHRAALSPADRRRIVPGQTGPFSVPVNTVLIMQQKALRPLVLNACRMLVSAASARSDKQLGVMFVLGSLSLVSAGAGTAYPWLVDQFSPGVTRVVNNQIIVVHPSVLGY